MAILLISDYGADAKQWRRELEQCAGPVDFRVWPEVGAFSEIEAILIDNRMRSRGGYGQFPRLRWVGFSATAPVSLFGIPPCILMCS